MLKIYSVHDVVLSCESRESKVFFVKLTFQMEFASVWCHCFCVVCVNKSFAELSLELHWEGRS